MKVQAVPFFIKPEAMHELATVWQILSWRELPVRKWKEFVFQEEMLLGIYPGIENNPYAHQECRMQLVGKTCLLGIIRAPNAVARLLDAAGYDRCPKLCNPYSIRYVCGNHEPIIMPNGNAYWYNGIHRPQTLAEAKAHAYYLGLTAADFA